MAQIERYVLVDEDGNEDSDEYEDFEEARREAARASTPSAVIRRIYVYDDSEAAAVPYASEMWPPSETAQTVCGSAWGCEGLGPNG